MRDVVNQKLFPYLERFQQRARGSDTIEYKIGVRQLDITDEISDDEWQSLVDLILG